MSDRNHIPEHCRGDETHHEWLMRSPKWVLVMAIETKEMYLHVLLEDIGKLKTRVAELEAELSDITGGNKKQ